MILSGGDSYSIFLTPDCTHPEHISNPHAQLKDAHAVQYLAKHYSVPCVDYGISGAGIQESVLSVLGALNHEVDAKLLVFYITAKNRVPVQTDGLIAIHTEPLSPVEFVTTPKPTVAQKFLDIDVDLSINDIGKVPKHCENLRSMHNDRSLFKLLDHIPKFKLDFDDIAYLSLLVNACKCKGVNILFVSEYVPLSDDMIYLFDNQEHVEFCDSFMHREFDIDFEAHRFAWWNHFCPHYQQKICEQFINKHNEFIDKSLL